VRKKPFKSEKVTELLFKAVHFQLKMLLILLQGGGFLFVVGVVQFDFLILAS
jgi:hypothetical protein